MRSSPTLKHSPLNGEKFNFCIRCGISIQIAISKIKSFVISHLKLGKYLVNTFSVRLMFFHIVISNHKVSGDIKVLQKTLSVM